MITPAWVWVGLGLFLIAGVLGVVRPTWGFMLGQRWWFRDRPEPSAAYAAAARASSVVIVLLVLLAVTGILVLELR
jgi:hypothetical protein